MKLNRARTVRRMILRAQRPPRGPSVHTGVTCFVCGHWARMIESQGRVQVICNANGAHKG